MKEALVQIKNEKNERINGLDRGEENKRSNGYN